MRGSEMSKVTGPTKNKVRRVAPTILTMLALLAVAAAPLAAQSTTRGRSRAPAPVTVTLQANVPGAAVSVDGLGPQGGSPVSISLPPGTYTFRVSAPGFEPWAETYDIQRNQSLVANLVRTQFELTVSSNVNATVAIDGASAGSTTLRRRLDPGTYEVRVTAPGYIDFATTVNLDRNRSILAQLRPATAQVGLDIPPALIDPSIPGAESMLTIFVDGRPVVGRTFELTPGRHTIRVRSGGLMYEITDDFEAGGTYRIIPYFSAEIRAE
jgi:hypothetical protein